MIGFPALFHAIILHSYRSIDPIECIREECKMTSYEIVHRAMTFQRPERIPFRFGTMGFSDFAGIGFTHPEGWKAPETPEGQKIDLWGCRWDTIYTNMGQVKGHPLERWENLKDYSWPDPDAPGMFDHILGNLRNLDGKYVQAGLGNGLFERAHFLRGFSNWMEDLYMNPKEAHDLIERILWFQIGLIRNYGKFDGIHSVSMCDDWGTQANVFISVPLFREFYKSRYKRLFNEAHSFGFTFYLHTCGKVNDYIEEWIDCGLDAIELQQPRALGIEEISRRYRGRICFSAPCDIQATLPNGDKEAIRREAKLLIDTWGTPDGGFIASDYGDCVAIGVSADSNKAQFEAFREFGNLKPMEDLE